MLLLARRIIVGIIDWFHRPFSKWIDAQTFRYLACGGSNTVLDVLIFFISYNFILQKQPVHVIGSIEIGAHIAAFLMSFSISFPIGFVLSRYIVFPESNLGGRIQLFRYILMVSMCIGLNYFFLKIFVDVFGWFPTPSKILTTALVAVFSYISQRKFTFKVKEVPVMEPAYSEQA